MSSVGYDLDTSGGLMPLIRALIKPPDEEANVQKNKKPQHPYYKRPGKGHNHDSCDACGEGGDLICCDRCPASFHLGCYDPPLDEHDIPAGLWLCKECRGSDAEQAATSSRSSRATSPADSKPEEKKTRSLRNKKKSKDSKEDEDKEKEEEKKEKEPEKELTPMEVLVKAAKIMNPTQFELPRDMMIPCLFPGTEKAETNGKNGNGSLVTVDSAGCVPLPAKSCFVCSGTCKQAPLLQCDYCPLLFHQDCLDPPLTALPTGRWMCPNHVEQYIDWKLVNSISATERVALWEKFSGPVDQHAIKIDFIRRARKHRPMFRMKVPVASIGRVQVPAMVRAHYANPAPLLPSRREFVRCRNVARNLPPQDLHEELNGDLIQTVCLNSSCPATSGGRCPMDDHQSPDQSPDRSTDRLKKKAPALHAASSKDAADDLKAIGGLKDEDDEMSTSSLSDCEFSSLSSIKRRRRSRNAQTQSPLQLRADAGAERLLRDVDQQLQRLDDRLVRLLAWQRLQQLLVGEQCYGYGRSTPLSAAAERLVARSVSRAQLAKHGFRHVALPSELLSRTERERISRAVWGGGLCSPGASPLPPTSPGHSLSDAVVRATLCPVLRPARHGLGDGLGRPIPMRLSRLTVGADSGCDVVLDPRCRCVSRRHATIFYDEVSRHFELINYSEWGSRVNGVLYTCDVDEREPRDLNGDQREQHDQRADAVREIVQRRMPKPIKLNGELTRPTANEPHCECPPSPPPGAAWEGSALVPHGALLSFGCRMFVFSVTSARAFPYEESVTEPAL